MQRGGRDRLAMVAVHSLGALETLRPLSPTGALGSSWYRSRDLAKVTPRPGAAQNPAPLRLRSQPFTSGRCRGEGGLASL